MTDNDSGPGPRASTKRASQAKALLMETKQMEARLLRLKLAMSQEKAKREVINQTAAKRGSIWSAARATEGRYVEKVMAKVHERAQRTEQDRLAMLSRARTRRQHQPVHSTPAPLSDNLHVDTNRSDVTQVATPNERLYEPDDTAPIAHTKSPASSEEYAIPVTTGASSISDSRGGAVVAQGFDPWSGEYDEEENRAAFLEARAQWLQAAQATNADAAHVASSDQCWNNAAPQSRIWFLDLPLDSDGVEVTGRLRSTGESIASEKACCYQCYALVYIDEAVRMVDTAMVFCTVRCHTRHLEEERERQRRSEMLRKQWCLSEPEIDASS